VEVRFAGAGADGRDGGGAATGYGAGVGHDAVGGFFGVKARSDAGGFAAAFAGGWDWYEAEAGSVGGWRRGRGGIGRNIGVAIVAASGGGGWAAALPVRNCALATIAQCHRLYHVG
jgi:hypothetical protein